MARMGYTGNAFVGSLPMRTTPNPMALHGEVQDSPGNLAERRALLIALAVQRARQAPNAAVGQRTGQRLSLLHGQASSPEYIQSLPQDQYNNLLKLLTQGRRRPSSARYSGLF